VLLLLHAQQSLDSSFLFVPTEFVELLKQGGLCCSTHYHHLFNPWIGMCSNKQAISSQQLHQHKRSNYNYVQAVAAQDEEELLLVFLMMMRERHPVREI
jgi:hypothetical protein